jgi:hypothetical protein
MISDSLQAEYLAYSLEHELASCQKLLQRPQRNRAISINWNCETRFFEAAQQNRKYRSPNQDDWGPNYYSKHKP